MMINTPAKHHGRNVFRRFSHFLALSPYFIGLMLFTVLSLFFLISEYKQSSTINMWRIAMMDMASPVLSALSNTGMTLKKSIESTIISQERLKSIEQENAQLEKWKILAEQLIAENQLLKTELKATSKHQNIVHTARVISFPSSPYSHSVLINAGKQDGIRKNQPIVTKAGMVGRVLNVGENIARVILITDINSRIPVILESNRAQAILAGDHTHHPQLIHFAQTPQFQPGDRVLTSGKGGVFPPGLFIGTISKENQTNSIPTLDLPMIWTHLNLIHVLDRPSYEITEPLS